MTSEAETWLWPAHRLGQALTAIADHSNLREAVGVRTCLDPPAQILGQQEALAEWIECAALELGIEARRVEVSYSEFALQLRRLGPALLQVPNIDGSKFLIVLSHAKVLTPDLKKVRINPSIIRSTIYAAAEEPIASEVSELLSRVGISPTRRRRAQDSIVRERLRTTKISGVWTLQLPQDGSFWRQIRRTRMVGLILALASSHTLQYVVLILAWWVVGSHVLIGRMDAEWLIVWSLLLLTLVPLRVLGTWLQGLIGIRLGVQLKLGLFAGTLQLQPDDMRCYGVGELLGCVLESETAERLAVRGGYSAAVAIIEIIIAASIICTGSGAQLNLIMLSAWILVAVGLAYGYVHRLRTWSCSRLNMTHGLIENMVGHRTRLVQLVQDRWHCDEDRALAGYLKASEAMDGWAAALIGLLPRGWLVLGLLGLMPEFFHGKDSPPRLAIALGAILLCYRAWGRLSGSASQLAAAAIAWRQASVLWKPASRLPVRASSALPVLNQSLIHIEARDISFQHSDRTEPVLRNCTFRIGKGERVMLQGSSGAGKSTLVSLLSGLRRPQSGTLLIDGVDSRTLASAAWQRRVAVAPQFHENHILSGTLAFNLFLGNRKVLGKADFETAHEICRELGLGALLDRMPSGILQMVGETGWQLSHGERSRIYLARTLLQDAELVILDESFAVLDPENMTRALKYAIKHARTLLVVTH